MTETTLPRMRTPAQAADEIKKLDPQTVIRTHHIRVLMNSGAVAVVKSGRRMFVNLDQLITYLNMSGLADLNPQQQGVIRPVLERMR